MSEKRFYITDTGLGLDTVSDEMYSFGDEEDFCRLFDKLNEQQSIIQRFEEYVFSDERILCYNCLFCQEKDIYEVKCKIKGSVDVHGTCQYYEKNMVIDV